MSEPEFIKDKLIVALDVNSAEDALQLVSLLDTQVGMFKIGSQLFTANGPELVRRIIDGGAKVFLDLKFHDIPHQVAGSAASATELGVSMFTLHASGGVEMMRRAVETSTEVALRKNIQRPSVVAVTILTSIDDNTLSQIGVAGNANDSVLRLARLAQAAAVDGVVASPREAQAIRTQLQQHDFLIVTPGIRPTGEEGTDDQKRVATPESALSAGASFLVVGRPITNAKDPALAAAQIVQQMTTATRTKAAELT